MIVLYILVKIILYLLLALILLVAMIMVIPFRYGFSGEKYSSTRVDGWIAWLFGHVRMSFGYHSDRGLDMNLELFGFNRKISSSKSKGSKKTVEKTGTGEKKEKPGYSYITYDVIKKLAQTVFKILNHCKPGNLHIAGKVGFDDPMYTGLLYGIKSICYPVLNKYDISVQITFDDEVLEGNFGIRGRIQLGYLIFLAIAFVLTKPFRSILFKNINYKIKRRLKKWQISTSERTWE